MRMIFVATAALSLSSALAAQNACPPIAAGAPVNAAATSAALSNSMLALGKRAEVALKPTAEVRYATPPAKAPAAGTSGGIVSFAVAKAGTYRVALGAGAWIDVVQNGQVVASTDHGHIDDCSGLKKRVDFMLQPGSVTLQIAGNAGPSIAVLVTPVL